LAVAVSIDIGPMQRIRYGVNPLNPNALIFLSPGFPSGCAMFSLPMLVLGIYGQVVTLKQGPSPPDWTNFVCANGLAVFAMFSLLLKRYVIIDRASRSVRVGHSLLGIRVRSKRENLEGYSAITLARADRISEDSKGKTSRTTEYPVSITGENRDTLIVFEAPVWEAALNIAEAVSSFIELPLNDTVRGVRREPSELTVPVYAQTERAGDDPPESDEKSKRGAQIVAHPDGSLSIDVPRPRLRLTGLTVLVLLFWSLPVGLLGADIFTICVPVIVVFVAGIKADFGYRANISVTPEWLRITTRGLIGWRTLTVPLAEVEDIFFIKPDWGGPRNVLAHAFEGFLVVGAGTRSIRFGHGLSREELLYVRRRILSMITRHCEEPRPNAFPSVAIPQFQSNMYLIVGFMLGVLAAHSSIRALAPCVRAPFLEHLVSAGSLAGLAMGNAIAAAVRRSRTGFAASLLAAAAVVFAFNLLLQSQPPITPRVERDPSESILPAAIGTFVQHRPTFDEKHLLFRKPARGGFTQHHTSHDQQRTPSPEPAYPDGFWLGALAAGIVLNSLVVVACGVVAAAWSLVRRRHNAPK